MTSYSNLHSELEESHQSLSLTEIVKSDDSI